MASVWSLWPLKCRPCVVQIHAAFFFSSCICCVGNKVRPARPARRAGTKFPRPARPKGRYKKSEARPPGPKGRYKKSKARPPGPKGRYKKPEARPPGPKGRYKKSEARPPVQYGPVPENHPGGARPALLVVLTSSLKHQRHICLC